MKKEEFDREDFDVEDMRLLAPLAERMRPKTLNEFLGQSHLVGENSTLRRAIEANRVSSSIFFGPPGTGKTSLAHIISEVCGGRFVKLNAVTSGVADAKKVIEEAKRDREMYGKKTYLLLDECHRWSKAQSDCVLSAIEQGYIVFIGSTTENPFYSMTRAIVSRCRVYEFKPLEKSEIKRAIARAITDRTRGFGTRKIEISKEAIDQFCRSSGGDVRNALGALEIAVLTTKPDAEGKISIDEAVAKECTGGRILSIDDDIFFDMLSAFGKSLRGSDANASVYWAIRLVESGCDPQIVIRRLIAHSSEDVGLANTEALLAAVSALTAYQNLGMPEGLIPMVHAILVTANSPKSNSVVNAIANAKKIVEKTFKDEVPAHLKNYNHMNEKRGKYKYPHDFGGYVKQQYLPEEIKDEKIYERNKNDKI